MEEDILDLLDCEDKGPVDTTTSYTQAEEQFFFTEDAEKPVDNQNDGDTNLILLSEDSEINDFNSNKSGFEIDDLFFDNSEGSEKIEKIDKIKPIKISKAEKKVARGISKPKPISKAEGLIIERLERKKGFISEEEKFVILELEKIKKEKLKNKRRSKKKKKAIEDIKAVLGENKTNLFLRLNKKIKELEKQLKAQKKQEPVAKRGKWKRSTQEQEVAELDSLVSKTTDQGKFLEPNKSAIEMLLSIGQIEPVGQLRQCKACAKHFYATAYDVNRGVALFCSKECCNRRNL